MISIFCSVSIWKWSLKRTQKFSYRPHVKATKRAYDTLVCTSTIGWPATGWFYWTETYFPMEKSDLKHNRQKQFMKTQKIETLPLFVSMHQCRNCAPCRPPRAARSHSSSVGSLLPFHWQKAWASFQLTWTTGKSKRSRMPEPGPAGWATESQMNKMHGRLWQWKIQIKHDFTCLQNARSIGSHQGADFIGRWGNASVVQYVWQIFLII